MACSRRWSSTLSNKQLSCVAQVDESHLEEEGASHNSQTPQGTQTIENLRGERSQLVAIQIAVLSRTQNKKRSDNGVRSEKMVSTATRFWSPRSTVQRWCGTGPARELSAIPKHTFYNSERVSRCGSSRCPWSERGQEGP